MNPIISVGIYSVGVLLTVLAADGCLRVCCAQSKTGRKSGVLKAARRIVYPLVAVLALLPILGAFLPDSRFKFTLTAAGNIWLGFFIYFFGSLLILGILFLVVIAVTHRKSRVFAGLVIIISLATGLGVMAYGMVHARQTKVTRYSVSLKQDGGNEPAGEAVQSDESESEQKDAGREELGTSEEERTYKIVLLADLHLSVNSSLSMIRRVVDLTNAEEPDVIVVAGDIFTSTYAGLRDPDAYAAVLRTLEAPDGVYMVAGNHDVEETLFGGFPISPISEAFRTEEMAGFFADCGFTVLDDELVGLAGGELILAGRLDGEKAGDGTTNRMSADELLADADPDKPVIVLEHEPKEFKELREAGADLVLCGHTHNGQIFPGNYFTRFFNSNPYGLRIVDELPTIVTAGVGFYGPPMRVGTDSEVTVVEVTVNDK